ncbi:isopentenyl-diphosphate delta-isomerase idi1 [Lobulomyces angularis]|nr:isopentenyl-diphosphate delta-isomerase idi1 [Lobulomyces angularis]
MTLDPEQERLMKEECILVDYNDNVLRGISKRESHLVKNIEADNLLHRAFSVFIFNKNKELLLQQRSSEKITFPDFWTNTCCSHPLFFEDELQSKNQFGVKIAARRKLEHELGIPFDEVSLDNFQFLTRIHYKAPFDDIWGEHEIDYILFLQTEKDVSLNLNLNEVKDVKYVDKISLIKMMNDPSLKITPWFKLIVDNFIMKWWESLDNLPSDNLIHRL